MSKYRLVESEHSKDTLVSTDTVLNEWSNEIEDFGPEFLKHPAINIYWMRPYGHFNYLFGTDYSYRLECWSEATQEWKLVGALDKRKFDEDAYDWPDDSDPTKSLEIGLKPERYGD